MLSEMLKAKLSSLFNNASFFIVILFVLFVAYAFSERKKGPVPKLFDIREILYGYYQVFKKKKDFFYLLAVVSLLTRITMLLNLETDKSFSQISVILSLLVSAIIGLIPMALSKSDNIQEMSSKNLSHVQKLTYIKDLTQVGMFNILISVIDLIMIFLFMSLQPSDSNQYILGALKYSIYLLFYLFAFNILIIMHKLYVVYFE